MRKPGADQQKNKETETKWQRLLTTYIITVFFFLLKNSHPDEKTRINFYRNLIVIQ